MLDCFPECPHQPSLFLVNYSWQFPHPMNTEWYLTFCCCQVTSLVSDSVRPDRWQPTRLLRPWDSPGKNTRVGCYFILQCMKVKSENKVTQSWTTPSDPVDCSLPGSSVHGIFQARVLEWVAIAFSKRGSLAPFRYSNLDSSLWLIQPSISPDWQIRQINENQRIVWVIYIV